MAFKDATAGQSGGLCTGIGFAVNAVYDGVHASLTPGSTITIPRIGGVAAGTLEDSAYPGKAVSLRLTTGSVADGAVVVAGHLNRTGQTVATGKYVFAVAA